MRDSHYVGSIESLLKKIMASTANEANHCLIWNDRMVGRNKWNFIGWIVLSLMAVFPVTLNAASGVILAKYSVIGKSVSTEMGEKTKKDIDKNIFLIVNNDKVYLLLDDTPLGIDTKSMKIWTEKWIEIKTPNSNVVDIRTQDQRIKKMRQLMEQKQALGDYSPVSLEDIGEEAPKSKVKRKIKQFEPVSYEQFSASNDLSTTKLFHDTFYEKFFGIKDTDVSLTFQNKSSEINGFQCGFWAYEFGHKPGLMTVIGAGSNGKAWVTNDGRLRPLSEAMGKIPADIYDFIKMAITKNSLLSIMRQTNGVPIRINEILQSVYGLGSKSHSIRIELAAFETDKSISEMSSMLPGPYREGLIKMMKVNDV